MQVCDREDSESYAKRTISEIETCLGFAFHGAGEEEVETITNAELEVSCHTQLLDQGQTHAACDVQVPMWWGCMQR